MDTKEQRTRGHLKRTKKNYHKCPSLGREASIERLESHLRLKELIRIVEADPDALVKFSSLRRKGLI